MTVRSLIAAIVRNEDLNFLLTNRIPRIALTRFIGWFSQIEQPWVRDVSIGVWRLFSDLDLSEAKKTSFRSMHDCFTRELKEGARPIDSDPSILASPCDAIVGACGRLADIEMLQVKGFPYSLVDLVGGNAAIAERHRNGQYVTLRLTSSMYHRFHAPHNCRIEHVTSISGDTWNVNPIALKRIERLFCKNERAVIETRLIAGGHAVTLVPVAAILVASLRLHCLDRVLGAAHRGARTFRCQTLARKGEELGWFQHGSTIIVLAPPDFTLSKTLAEGGVIRMGEPLMRLPPHGRDEIAP